MDTERLTKLLMLTTSSNDAEALAAMRKANALLAQAGLNWEKFIGLRKAIAERTTNKTTVDASDEIEQMFDLLMSSVKGEFSSWIESAYDYYQRNGHLTARQYDVLKSAFEARKEGDKRRGKNRSNAGRRNL